MHLQRELSLQLRAICTVVGQLSLASIAIPLFIDKQAPGLAFLGLLVALIFWGSSLLLAYFTK